MNSRLHSVWVAYIKCLESRPLLTKSITSGCITLSADVICQLNFPPVVKYTVATREKYNGGKDSVKINNDSDIDSTHDPINSNVVSLKDAIVPVYEPFNLRRMMNFTTIGMPCMIDRLPSIL